MKFKTVAEAFNYYKDFNTAALEKRAQEIAKVIETDENADIESLNIELRGIKEAKENNVDNVRMTQGAETRNGFNIISGMNTDAQEAKTFGDNVFDTAEYRSAFFKSLLGHTMNAAEMAAYNAGMKIAEKRSDIPTTSGDVPAILPTQTLNEIISKARTMGGLLAECRSFSLPSKIAVPVATPKDKAAWHTEGVEVESEKAAPISVTFDGYEIMKVFSISAKVRAMSINAFESYLVQELTACVMDTIADALINGTGSNQGTGLLKGITWTTAASGKNHIQVAKTGSFTYANAVETVALLKRGYSNGAKWCMNNATLYNVFYGMVDANQRPIFIADPKAESIGKILGYEVIIDDNMPDNSAIFGNFAQYMGYNLPEGISVEVSRESSFRKGLIDYRAMAIADCKPIASEAFVLLDKATA